MKKADKICAFCFQKNKLTREHVWPEGILKRLPTYRGRFFEKADKVIDSDHIIKDVCVSCNNGVLSKLDEYGCLLFDKYFHKIAEPEEEVNFEYNYDTFLRWLLKIAYNTTRSSANPNITLLQPMAPYIIGQNARPSGIELYLDIVTHSMIPTTSGVKKFPATAFRSARIVGVPPLPGWCTLRLVSINSFYFYILLFEESNHANEELVIVRRSIKGTLVSPENTDFPLMSATTGAFEVHRDHMLSNLQKYRQFFRGDGK